MKNLADMGKSHPEVFVGIRAEAGAELVTIAAVNEFGSADGHVPERSFLRSTVDENHKKYGDLLQTAVERGIDKGTTALRRELGRVGAVAAGDVQRKIRDLKDPPNAPSTIAAKGSDNPLVDTGRLRQSIDWKVEGV